jgi:hypothetical protein
MSFVRRRLLPLASPSAFAWGIALQPLALVGCVPRERPHEEVRASSAATAAKTGAAGASAVGAPPASSAPPSSAPPLSAPPLSASPLSASPSPPGEDPALSELFTDDFERAELGPAWRSTSSAWALTDGMLCGENARNHPLWLARRLPDNASIEFTALSTSSEGDIKAEFWGDGRSAASGQSYTDATSYIAIFGGWKNAFHVLARLDEHAPDRKEIKVAAGAADFMRKAVIPNQSYQFRVERRDGHTVRWSVDGVDLLSYADEHPLRGVGHEHFGFNDWQVRVCFDNLRVAPL